MTIKQITSLQKEHGTYSMQCMITSGDAWKMEGSYGRSAMSMLQSGACYLPENETKDFWGNTIPSRNDLKPGTKGTLENSIRYYESL